MEINIVDYISEERMREIAEEEFKRHIDSLLARNYKDIWSVLSDTAYLITVRALEDSFKSDEKELKEELVKQVEWAIGELKKYDIFHESGTYSDRSYGQELLELVVNEHKGMIAAKVEEIVDGLDVDSFMYLMSDYIADAFKDWMKTYSAKTRVNL